MTTLTPQKIADLKASIAKKYEVRPSLDGLWCVTEKGWAINDNDHDDPLDAEAEMDAIIRDKVKASMEEME